MAEELVMSVKRKTNGKGGTNFDNEVPIGVLAENVIMANGENLEKSIDTFIIEDTIAFDPATSVLWAQDRNENNFERHDFEIMETILEKIKNQKALILKFHVEKISYYIMLNGVTTSLPSYNNYPTYIGLFLKQFTYKSVSSFPNMTITLKVIGKKNIQVIYKIYEGSVPRVPNSQDTFILKANNITVGDTIYPTDSQWVSLADNLPDISASKITGTLPPENGGTGQNSLYDSAYHLIDSLNTNTRDLDDNQYIITSLDGAGATKKNISKLTTYMSQKLPNATTTKNGLMSASDKIKLNNIPAEAEENQNAFSNIKIGSTTIAADAKKDTLTLAAGSNITLTPDADSDKITIAVNSPLPIANGGTGAATAKAARESLGIGNLQDLQRDMTNGNDHTTIAFYGGGNNTAALKQVSIPKLNNTQYCLVLARVSIDTDKYSTGTQTIPTSGYLSLGLSSSPTSLGGVPAYINFNGQPVSQNLFYCYGTQASNQDIYLTCKYSNSISLKCDLTAIII